MFPEVHLCTIRSYGLVTLLAQGVCGRTHCSWCPRLTRVGLEQGNMDNVPGHCAGPSEEPHIVQHLNCKLYVSIQHWRL